MVLCRKYLREAVDRAPRNKKRGGIASTARMCFEKLLQSHEITEAGTELVWLQGDDGR